MSSDVLSLHDLKHLALSCGSKIICIVWLSFRHIGLTTRVQVQPTTGSLPRNLLCLQDFLSKGNSYVDDTNIISVCRCNHGYKLWWQKVPYGEVFLYRYQTMVYKCPKYTICTLRNVYIHMCWLLQYVCMRIYIYIYIYGICVCIVCVLFFRTCLNTCAMVIHHGNPWSSKMDHVFAVPSLVKMAS